MAGDKRKDMGWKISHILLKHLSVQQIRQKEQTQTNRSKQLNIKMVLEGSAAASFHGQDQSLYQTISETQTGGNFAVPWYGKKPS